MRIYVAGPMTGIPEFNYPAFREAGENLVKRGHEVLNPVDSEKLNATGKPQSWAWYMRHALRMVLDAEALAVLPGWEGSRGACLEISVADELGMPVYRLDEWMNQ